MLPSIKRLWLQLNLHNQQQLNWSAPQYLPPQFGQLQPPQLRFPVPNSASTGGGPPLQPRNMGCYICGDPSHYQRSCLIINTSIKK